MSGIVGIVNLDGAPAERQLLQQMTEFMAYRGPDAQDIWSDGHVGFGHTMLRTTRESLRERQPCSLDGQVWITADARVDGRADLIQKLESEGRTDLETATDVDLLLHAYHVWGEDCVKHLLGDFAFAIWDKRRQSLFCARDHFGVKPFYYAHVANCLIFSNTLNCLRLHPAVSDELNELAIGDFLLFSFNQEPSTTTFADIQRLPPAHHLKCSEGVPHLTRYWTLPVDEPIRYKRASDYVDHFKELLRTAVDDRMRTNRVGVFMSGGLDSTTVAATAHELLAKQPEPFDLRAYTIVYDRLIPDEERYYSGLVAKALGIPIHYLVADDYTLYERYDRPELHKPEPVHEPLAVIGNDIYQQEVVAHSRVVLSGQGSDPALCPSGSYFFYLLKGLRFGRIVADVGQYIMSHGQLPGVGFRAKVKRWLGKRPWQPPYPTWLNEAFAARLNLPVRWEELNKEPPPIHPIRPEAYQYLTAPLWTSVFESSDPSATFFPVEVRYPFFDLRLMNYLLAIPPLPWCLNKELLRVAMLGTLPEPVRLRPKAPLAGSPLVELLRQSDSKWVDDFEPKPELTKYVHRDLIPHVAGGIQEPEQPWINLRPLSLNYWLHYLATVKDEYKLPIEDKSHELTGQSVHKKNL